MVRSGYRNGPPKRAPGLLRVRVALRSALPAAPRRAVQYQVVWCHGQPGRRLLDQRVWRVRCCWVLFAAEVGGAPAGRGAVARVAVVK